MVLGRWLIGDGVVTRQAVQWLKQIGSGALRKCREKRESFAK